MKDYMNGIVENAKKLAGVLVEKTSDTVDAARTEMDIHKAQSQLDREYKTLGQIMFQVETGAMEREEVIVEAAVKRIQEQSEKLAALMQKKEEAKAQKQADTAEEATADAAAEEASDATAEATAEAEATVEEKRPERDEDGYFVLKFCPKCKVGNHPDAEVCVNCGADLTEKEA